MFSIPEKCRVNSIVFKKSFYENGDFSTSEKDLFSEIIDKVVCLYSLKADNINIDKYKDDVREYEEIVFFEVRLSKDGKLKTIAELIMSAVPYPMVLVFRFGDKVQIWVAHQRINLNDNSKNVLEDFIFTDWLLADSVLFDKLNILKLNLANFYLLYSDIVDILTVWNAECLGLVESGEGQSAEALREQMGKLADIDKQIEILKSRVSKETQFNKRLELNIELKQVKEKRQALLSGAIE